MSTYRLEKVFAPSSMVLVGASPRRGIARAQSPEEPARGGIPGSHPSREPEISGDRRHPLREARRGRRRRRPISRWSRRRHPRVPGIVEALGRKGVAAAIVVTAGLGYGPGSLSDEARIIARRTGLRLIGPNCLGVMAPFAGLNASFAARGAKPGDLALVSQSGAIAAGLVEWAAAAQRRLLGGGVPRRQGRRRFRRLPRLFRERPRNARDPALRREHQRCAQVHVGGPRRGPREAGRRHQVGTSRAGRPRRRDPYGRARGIGRGLRCRVPPRRSAPGARSRRALRRGRDARPPEALRGQEACGPHQRRRRRRARGRPADRSRRDARRTVATGAGSSRRHPAADLVARESRRHHRRCGRRALRGGARRAARGCRERRRPGAQRADGARERVRRGRGRGRTDRAGSRRKAMRRSPSSPCGSARTPPRRPPSRRRASRISRRKRTRCAASCSSCATARPRAS